ncbi:amino acid ABC transporter permease [Telmatospirillum sp.]|uniref:amino acid ABC transporter permease n=1 Tax=Telmatospirillum sp. TaxID=2079197 RepID=UPI002841CCFD|nr:amino acid ABC transporter permease [Telmatospirillum sp.]MDR3439071.1 amino acid ABC transporter permease [Telmatospirillum sp.]
MPSEEVISAPGRCSAAVPAASRGTSEIERAARLSFRRKVWAIWAGLCVLLLLAAIEGQLDFALIGQKLPFMLGLRLTSDGFVQGVALTLVVTAASMIFATFVALLTALGRLSTNPIAFALATFYASIFRGTPLMIQVLIIYLALPQVGIVLSGFTSGVIALGLNYGAYLAETIRAGISSVPAGQREAAMALGMRRFSIALKIVAPQAMRVIIPPAGALFVSMLKDSSLVSLMGLWELNFLAQSYGRSTFRYLEMLLSAALVYWILSILFEFVQYRLEQKFGRSLQAIHP